MSEERRFTAELAEQRLDLFLSVQTGESRAFIKFQIQRGNVFLNGQVIEKPSQTVRLGDEVRTSFKSEIRLELKPVEKKLDILYEDEALLVLNKPQGWVVHPAAGHRGETLVHYLLHYLQKNPAFSQSAFGRPGIVHRLDRGTSGCLVIAKSRPILEKLASQFKEREVKKQYEAIVWGKMQDKGHFKTCIGRHPIDRKRMSSKSLDGKEAETGWERIGVSEHFSHVALYPRTGRTHQLRVHLSEAGHSIVGDSLYGKRLRKTEHLDSSIPQFLTKVSFPFLHAKVIAFTHPLTGNLISATAPRPTIFDDLLKVLRTGDLK